MSKDAVDLKKAVIENIAKGYSIENISSRMDMPKEAVVKVWQDYVEDYHNMPQEERWIVHELRLEYLLQRATNLIEQGMSEEFGGTNLNAALKILEKLEQLQDLNKSRKAEANVQLVEMTARQVSLMYDVIDSLKYKLASALPLMISDKPKRFWNDQTVVEVFEDMQLEVLNEDS